MSKFNRALAAGTAAALCLTAGMAVAAPVSSSQTIASGFGSTNWQITNTGGTSGGPFGGNCDGGQALTIQDASGPTGAGDAFDNAWNISIDGVAYSAGATVDLTGTTYTAPAAVMSGLNVSVQYHVVPGDALARILVTLQNPGASPIATAVQVGNNWGSDGSTVIRDTSSGDTTVTTADRWLITSDNGPSDPVNLSVMYGTGAAVTPASYTTTVFDCAGPQGLGTVFNVSVPAGETRHLMMFAGLGGVLSNDNLVASAQAAATFFTDLDAMDPLWLDGLSQAQLDRVVNWAPALPSFTTCAAEGLTGDPLKLCRLICESPLSTGAKQPLIQLWRIKMRSEPPCTAIIPD